MQSPTWYFNRLGRMSAAEMIHHAHRQLRKAAGRFMDTTPEVCALSVPSGAVACFVRRPASVDTEPYIVAAERIRSGVYRIFDLPACRLGNPPVWNRDPLTRTQAPLRPSMTIDYRDQQQVGNIKYLWEPNRHLHLVTLAQAYQLTGKLEFAREIRLHIDSWIQQCPVGRGPNWCSALEGAIRLINWSVTWQLLGGERSPLFAAADGAAFRERWLGSIHHHFWWISDNLSQFSSANNHLIGELAGLSITAATWPYWPRVVERGRRCGELLQAQALAQNAPDGGNREQAIAYQQFVLDFLLLAGLAARSIGRDFSPAYWQRIERMIEFIAALMDVAGNMPMLGDADDGYVLQLAPQPQFCPWRSLLASGAVLFGRPDFAMKARAVDAKTQWLLGADAGTVFRELLAAAVPASAGMRALPHTGYYIMGDRPGTSHEVRLLIDAAPLGYLSLAAHGHADALSVTLNVGGVEFLVDPGTYAYHTQPLWRRYFRGTAAHNTVVVDGQDQSQQCGNFMWSKHARARCLFYACADKQQRFIGEHDGYTRLSDPVIHRREVVFYRRRGRFDIVDTLVCKGRHQVRRRWHLAEALEPVEIAGGIEVRSAGHGMRMSTAEGILPRVICGGSAQEGGWVSRGFGRKAPCVTLEWPTIIEGTTALHTRIEIL